MDNRPILFIDSGIGGLTYCRDFLKKNPGEEVCYLADRQNFPYGPREKDELLSILIPLTEKLLKTINPKIIVLACNTATVSALEPLRQRFTSIQFVGTVPAIKPAASASKTGNVGVLGTARTIEDPYNQNLLKDHGGTCEIFGVAAPELVEFVEHCYYSADQNKKNEIVKKYVDMFRAEKTDTLVLGCTHFLYLIEEFRHEAEPNIKVFDSLEGITKRIEFLLDENNMFLRADNKNPDHKLIITGTEAPGTTWDNIARELNFKLSLSN